MTEDCEKVREQYIKKYKELLGIEYDAKAEKTRTMEQMLKDGKAICYDIVNYLYYQENKTGKCYFIWFNTDTGNTHTFYINKDGYRIEMCPPEDGPLTEDDIWVEKSDYGNIVKDLTTTFVDEDTFGINNTRALPDEDYGPYDVIEYIPKDESIDIIDFIEEKFKVMDKRPTLYHVSEKKLDWLIPRIPKSDFEDQETPRICFAKDIQGCLIGAYEDEDITGKILHVYSIKTNDYYEPSEKEVQDVNVTGEVWYEHTCYPKFEYDIKITGIKEYKLKKIGDSSFKIPVWNFKKVNP